MHIAFGFGLGPVPLNHYLSLSISRSDWGLSLIPPPSGTTVQGPRLSTDDRMSSGFLSFASDVLQAIIDAFYSSEFRAQENTYCSPSSVFYRCRLLASV